MSKYYTPNIEEFHVGFRYEFYSDPMYRVWSKSSCREDNVVPWLYLKESKDSIRIKCLDQQDIEELGWVRDKEDDRMYYISFELGECSLHFSEEDEDIVITSLHPKVKNFDKVIFHGKIKNYNELKKLMEQLEINK